MPEGGGLGMHRLALCLTLILTSRVAATNLCPSPGGLSTSGSLEVSSGYGTNLDCTATLSVGSGFVVATVSAFGTDPNDLLYFHDGSDTSSPLLGQFSGSLPTPFCMISTGSVLTVRFVADDYLSGTGISLSFAGSAGTGYYIMGPQNNSVPLSASLSAANPQPLKDRYTPCSANYLSNTATARQITAPLGQHVLLTVTSFASEAVQDKLTPHDGTYLDRLVLGVVSGTVGGIDVPQLPLCFVSGSSNMYLSWITNGNTNAAGWLAMYEAVTLGYELLCSVDPLLTSAGGVLRDRYNGTCRGLYRNYVWTSCSRQIVAPGNAWRVRVTFTEFELDSKQILRIDNTTLQSPLPLSLRFPYCFVSSSPVLTITSGTSQEVISQSKGWQLEWDLVPEPSYEIACVQSSLPITASSGLMKDRYTTECSPVYFSTDATCARQIQAPPGALVLVQFSTFELATGGGLVRFYDTSTSAPSSWSLVVSGNASGVASFSGLASLQSCFAVTRYLTLQWERSKIALSGPGWGLNWTAVSQPSYELVCASPEMVLTNPGTLRSHYSDAACSTNYAAFRGCRRTIRAPVGKVIRLTATLLNAPGTDFRIFDGTANPLQTGIVLQPSTQVPICVFQSSNRTVTVTWDAFPGAAFSTGTGWALTWAFVDQQGSDAFCGGEQITASSGIMSYRPLMSGCQPGFLPNYVCRSSFSAPPGYFVRFIFTQYIPNDYYDTLELWDSSAKTTRFALLQNNYPNYDPICLQTTGSFAYLQFSTPGNNNNKLQGWIANWTFVPNSALTPDAINFCSSSSAITSGPGYIVSQGTSRACLGTYGDNWHCSRVITAPVGGGVVFTLLSQSTEPDYDYLRLYDGSSVSATKLYDKSGLHLTPVTFVSSGRHFFVDFTSDNAWGGTGWQAYFSFQTLTPSPSPTGTPSQTYSGTTSVSLSRIRTSTPTYTPTPSGTATPLCGDGTVEGNEECDDGNSFTGDGCSGTCSIEPQCHCSAAPLRSVCWCRPRKGERLRHAYRHLGAQPSAVD
eukprot:TRINITY_DN14472_c0_g1_i1.p1 TRINITY_DN14472_c0_g1~~TRINITY_DN14472_c0_g1_i1.p1  ORF type:complete len:1022 (+),score=86.24 TRINITY_DN14472_c0_g1_i1:36-3101(+)